jgi:hypothetical protein
MAACGGGKKEKTAQNTPRPPVKLAALIHAKDEHNIRGGAEGAVQHALIVALCCPDAGPHGEIEVFLQEGSG